MASVRPVGVVYADAAGSVEAFGVEVSVGAAPGIVSSVGWDVQSDTGGAQIVCGLGPSRHPHPRLPHRAAAGGKATWMMTADEMLTALADNRFGLVVDEVTAVLRPFAIIDRDRVCANETVRLSGR